MDFIMSLITPVIERLRDHILDHVLQTIRVGDNVDALDRKIENLRQKRQDVEDTIKVEEPSGKVASKEAEGWLDDAKTLEEEASVISNKYADRNCMVLGSYSFNCYLSHSISVSTLDLKARVETELQTINTIQLTKYPPPPLVQLLPTATLGLETGSEIWSKLDKALEFLRSSDGGVLGIWGMGGVGKTTVLRHINNALASDLSLGFHRVIFVTASRDCSIEKIQKDIANELKLTKGGDCKTNIFNFLNDKSFVILLDDLWERLDLEHVGIPPLGVNAELRRKLILTTRNQQVCFNMDTRHYTIKVDCLTRDNARCLFREKVGEEAINSHPLLQNLADKIADECDGLPIALITIARAMAGKTSIKLWSKALKDLHASKISIIVGKQDPLPLLKISYDYLENASLQECLLLCALWPEDSYIQVDEIMRCWMGHNLLGEFNSVEEAYDNGSDIINSLHNASLLESFDYYEGQVRLHDLIRDMALWIIEDSRANEKKWVVLSELNLVEAPQDKNMWKEAYKITLARNRLMELPSNISAPNLNTLMLQGNNLKCEGLRIIQNFHELKYLDISGNGLQYFPVVICRLYKLEHLDLSVNNIDSLPEDLKDLKRLKYLLLNDNSISRVPSQWLTSGNSLEVLHLFSSSNNNHSLVIDELEGLKGQLKGLGINACSQLDLDKLDELSVPITKLWRHDRKGERGTSFDLLPRPKHPCDPTPTWASLQFLGIGSLEWIEKVVINESYGSFPKSLMLSSLKNCEKIVWKRVENKEASLKLTRVDICDCPKLKHLNWLVNLPFLEELSVQSCYQMKHVICIKALDVPSANFRPCLKNLFLSRMPKLEALCNWALDLPSLEYLRLHRCKRLKKLPFDTPASCRKLKSLIAEDEWWENTFEMEDEMKTYLRSFASLY